MTCRSSHAGSSHSPMIFRLCKTLASPDLQCSHWTVVVVVRQCCNWEESCVKKVLVSEQMAVFSLSPLNCKSPGSFLTPADGIWWHWQVHPSCVLGPGLHTSSPSRSQHHLERFIARPRSKGQIFDVLVYVGWSSYTSRCPQQTHNPCLLSCNGQRHSVRPYNDCQPAGVLEVVLVCILYFLYALLQFSKKWRYEEHTALGTVSHNAVLSTWPSIFCLIWSDCH